MKPELELWPSGLVAPSAEAPPEIWRDFGIDMRKRFGLGKPMVLYAYDPERPKVKFFLERPFLGDSDALFIFQTPACRFLNVCTFCDLPKSSLAQQFPMTPDQIMQQFVSAVGELRHGLHTFDRVTLSNDGSILDEQTFPRGALKNIVSFFTAYKNIRRLVLETRLLFVEPHFIRELNSVLPNAPPLIIDILTGLETANDAIRTNVLKKEPVKVFLQGLDQVTEATDTCTAYIMYKCGIGMSDEEATRDARDSIEFFVSECQKRSLYPTIRLNPTYAADGTPWERALQEKKWVPPRLTDVFRLAIEFRQKGLPLYMGASDEGLAVAGGTYETREDYTPALKKELIAFNTNPNYIPTSI